MIGKKTEGDIWNRHIIDSLQLINIIPNGFSSFIDIGSGAGLPGVVIKIANESLEANLVESNKKKSQFLKNVSKKLEIKTNVFDKRFEEVDGLKTQNTLLMSRAVCSLDSLLNMGLGYFKRGSIGIFHKGISWKDIIFNFATKLSKTPPIRLQKINYFYPHQAVFHHLLRLAFRHHQSVFPLEDFLINFYLNRLLYFLSFFN